MKHRGQDVGIGEKHQERGQEGYHHGNAEAHEGLGRGVRARGLDHSQVVTEAVIDVSSAVKSQVGSLHHCGDGQEEGSEPDTGFQSDIGVRGHEDRVAQGAAEPHSSHGP